MIANDVLYLVSSLSNKFKELLFLRKIISFVSIWFFENNLPVKKEIYIYIID